MKGRALHMLRPADSGSMTRETYCGRRSAGGGIGTQILTFSEDCRRHAEFEATAVVHAVTCKRCRAAMAQEGNARVD